MPHLSEIQSLTRGLQTPSGASGQSFINGQVTVTVPPPGRIEHDETVALSGVTALMRAYPSVAPDIDSDENGAEGLNIQAMSATAGAGTVRLRMAFGEPTSGPIKLNILAAA